MGIDICLKSEVVVVRQRIKSLALGRNGVAGEEIFVKAGRVHGL